MVTPALEELVREGLRRASRSLSTLADKPFTLAFGGARWGAPEELAHLIADPSAPVVAVHLGLSGEISGVAFFVLEAADAQALVDLLFEMPLGSTEELGELERSALAEVANIVTSACLNTLADATGFPCTATAPVLAYDMAGAVADELIAALLLQGDQVLYILNHFRADLDCHLLLIPDPHSLTKLQQALEQER